MKRVAASLLLLALVACGRDEPKLVTPKTTPTTEGDTFVTTPTTTAPTTTSQENTTTSLIAADAATPAAGACGAAPEGGAAEITLNPDVPSPRCVIVHSLNQLRFTNNTAKVQTVDVGYDSATLQPHASHLFAQRVGDYWADGVHRVRTGALYGGSGPEVWLKS